MTSGIRMVYLVGMMGVLCDMVAGIETDTDTGELTVVIEILELSDVIEGKTLFEAIHVVSQEIAKIELTDEVYQEMEEFHEEIRPTPEQLRNE